MRGSLGARLRKLSERLQRRPRVAKEDAETMEPSPVEQLQERVREAQEALGRSRHLLRSCDMVIDYERQLREALAARGQLGQALQPLALQALDLQADVSSLQHSGVRGQSRELVSHRRRDASPLWVLLLHADTFWCSGMCRWTPSSACATWTTASSMT